MIAHKSYISVPIILLELYLFSCTASVMPFFPEWLNSLFLYGFIISSFFQIAFIKKIKMRFASIWFICFFIWCLITCIFSTQIASSFSAWIELLKLLLFILCFQNIVKKDDLSGLMKALVMGPLVLFLYLFATKQLFVDERLGTTLVGNANSFALLFMVGAIAAIYLFFTEKRIVYKYIAAGAFAAICYSLALSGGRKFFVIPFFVVAMVFIQREDSKGRRKYIRNCLIIAILLLVIFYMVFQIPMLYNTIGIRFEGLFALVGGKGKIDASAKVRMNMIDDGISAWLEAPLLGYGLNSFAENMGYGAYAHNNYVELLYDIGLIGFTIYYSVFVYYLINLFKNKKNIECLFFLSTIFALLLFDYGAVSYNLYQIHVILLMASLFCEPFRRKLYEVETVRTVKVE